MRRFLLALALVAALLFSLGHVAATATAWRHVAKTTLASITRITVKDGSCTAFSIDDTRQLYLTAAHCYGPELRLDGEPAGVMFLDDASDLMVLLAPHAMTRAPLRPDVDAHMGDAALGAGYAYGWPLAQVRTGHVAAAPVRIFDQSLGALLSGVWLVVDFPFVGGMSGGPLVNGRGRVVGVMLQANHESGAARPIGDVLAHTARFWRHV